AASARTPGNSGSAVGLLPSASHLPKKNAVSQEDGTGSATVESFRVRWQSELATMHASDGGDGGGRRMATGNAGAAAGREAKSAVKVSASQQAGGASGSMGATAARNPERNSTIEGGDDALPETGPAGSAKSPEIKDTQNNRDARRRDVASHDQAKTD